MVGGPGDHLRDVALGPIHHARAYLVRDELSRAADGPQQRRGGGAGAHAHLHDAGAWEDIAVEEDGRQVLGVNDLALARQLQHRLQ